MVVVTNFVWSQVHKDRFDLPVMTPSVLLLMFSAAYSVFASSTSTCSESHLLFTFPVNWTELCDCFTNQLSNRFSIKVKSASLASLGVGSVIAVGVAW